MKNFICEIIGIPALMCEKKKNHMRYCKQQRIKFYWSAFVWVNN